jgi:MYXO-CTERM domain-containing protein
MRTQRMTKFSKLFASSSLAFALALGGQAMAAPVYHVTIDTEALSGQAGYLDFLHLALGNADPATATVTHLQGAFGPAAFGVGGVGGTPGSGITLDSAGGGSEFGQWAAFGGLFGFDVAFDAQPGPSAGAGVVAGSTFSVALLDDTLHYLGGTGDLVTIALQPGESDAIVADPAFANVTTVSTVPEPSTAWLAAAGLLLLAGRRRRAQR